MKKELNKKLMEAIVATDVAAVKENLEKGADPNYRIFDDKDEPKGLMQPTTPLRMVMFAISDQFVEEEGLKRFAEVAQILVEHGADPEPAMEIAENRYGRYKPEATGAFMDVWHIVAKAMAKRDK